jgi:hypothetical protein
MSLLDGWMDGWLGELGRIEGREGERRMDGCVSGRMDERIDRYPQRLRDPQHGWVSLDQRMDGWIDE